MLQENVSYQYMSASQVIQDYARVLYENYRARVMSSLPSVVIDPWESASPIIRREFIRDARAELGY